MKLLKRMISFMLAIMMVFGLTTTAFATNTTQTANLTIKGTVEGKQYDLYRIFDLTQSGENYSYTLNEHFAAFFEQDAYKDVDPVTFMQSLDNEASVLSALGRELLEWAIANNVAPTSSVTGGADKTTVENLPYGYYLLNPLGGFEANGDNATMFALNTLSGNEAEIVVKAVYPQIDKTVNEAKANSAAIGDVLNFALTSKVPDMAGYNHYIYTMEDTLSKGLTFNEGSIKVTVAEKELTGEEYILNVETAEDGKTKLEIAIKDFLQYKDKLGETVTVTYTATLNKYAEIGTANINSVVLKYSNDPKVIYEGDVPSDNPNKPFGETPESITKTYSTSLEITKIDGKTKAALEGAAFRIEGEGLNIVLTTGTYYAESENGTYWKLNDGSFTSTDPMAENVDQSVYADTETRYEKKVEVKEIYSKNETEIVNVEAFVDENGKLTFSGLNAGTYTITETVTPKGYNAINPIEVVIGFDAEKEEFTSTSEGVTLSANTLFITIENLSGGLFPSTGGIGVYVLYGLGAILLAAGVLLLCYRKKLNVEK